MANTSATGGYLTPTSTTPLEDSELDSVFQGAIAGVSGLAGQYVRPRWQTVVPKQPEPNVNWCAFGVTAQDKKDHAAIEHDSAGSGQDIMRRHEDITVLCTFYGPNCKRYAMTLLDGMYVPQNIEVLKGNGISFVEAGDVRMVPELVNEQWVKRADIRLRFRRMVSRTYAVLNILSAEITTAASGDGPSGNINVEQIL